MKKKENLIDWILQKRILSHIIFWFLLFISLPILAALNDGSVTKTIVIGLGFLPAQLLASYFLIYYQVPKLLFRKKYLKFGLSFLISAYFFLVLSRVLKMFLIRFFISEKFIEESLINIILDPFHLVIVYFPYLYVFVFLMFMTKSFKDRFEEKHQIEVLQKEKATTELKFLKAQTNPHFLFNSLNNLYSLTLDKSDKAPDVVLKLSGMLDYMLYQCKDDEVPIANEISFIQDYIDLESLRYGDKLQLNFNHNLTYPNILIAPLILISFVENAFKHGASNALNNSVIDIDLSTEKDSLCFKVFNTLPQNNSEIKKEELNSGIGFFNARRQLDLNYKNNYDLKITKTENDFLVVLNIKLK